MRNKLAWGIISAVNVAAVLVGFQLKTSSHSFALSRAGAWLFYSGFASMVCCGSVMIYVADCSRANRHTEASGWAAVVIGTMAVLLLFSPGRILHSPGLGIIGILVALFRQVYVLLGRFNIQFFRHETLSAQGPRKIE
jgi:hypothetical protein